MESSIDLIASIESDSFPVRRIAVGSIFTESNHLGGLPTDLAAFQRCQLLRGRQMNALKEGYVGGMNETLRSVKAEIVPLMVASACPGGPITLACYKLLKEELLERLHAALPVDGISLSLHGAAAAEGVDDVDGDVLCAVRKLVGPGVPIVASLDLHAHVTEEMVENADALIALETYPHRDAKNTGRRAVRMLLDIIDGHVSPAMVMAKVPVLTSAINASTEGNGPFAKLMAFAKSHEGLDGILSTSVFLVHPYLDAVDMGAGGLVITNDDYPTARSLASKIAEKYWDKRFEFEMQTFSPEEAIRLGQQIQGGPMLLVETSDCCGGGATGDSVASLRALLANEMKDNCLACVVDPEAALICHETGKGSIVTLSLGHKLDPHWGDSISVTGTVRYVSDGRFLYTGGMWADTEGNMGASAVLEVGSVQILITSEATYDWADEQYRSMGMRTDLAKFVVVKNPMNYIQGYRHMSKAAFVLDTPGPTPATLHGVQFSNVLRPYYPADSDIEGLTPRLLSRYVQHSRSRLESGLVK